MKRFSNFLICAAAIFAVTACSESSADSENTGGNAEQITIPQILRDITKNETAIDSASDRVLFAVVSSDARGGNINGSQYITIQSPDTADAGNGIILYGATAAGYRFGDLLLISLRKGVAKRSDYNGTGRRQISGVTDDDITIIENRSIMPVPVSPRTIASYFGQYVQIADASSPASGGTWCTSTTDGKFTFTASGEDITVFVKKGAADFAGRTFKCTKGDLCGHVSFYDNKPQLWPNSREDVSDFDGAPTPIVPDKLIYAETFDGNASFPAGTWADSDASWQAYGGEGAADVKYATSGVQIHNSNPSNGYTDASGKYYASIAKSTTKYLSVQNIKLGGGDLNLRLTFGCNFASDRVTLSVASSEKSADIAYTGSTNGRWGLGVAEFTLTGAVDKLTITFTNASSYIQCIDDIKLEAVSASFNQKVDLAAAQSNYAWAEKPRAEVANSDWKTITHWTTTVVSQKRVRNYTSCYDTRRHCPMWVAFPLHRCYCEGSGRSDTDSWAADPNLSDAEQSIIYVYDSSYADYQYWTNSVLTNLGHSGYWTRGHMCMSNYRPGAGKEINLQTFYSTNIAPQGFDAFSAKWLQAEGRAQDYYMCPDTLYYVCGCYFANENWKEKDASTYGNLSPASKECVVPTHFYKALLRTKSGSTGKAIQECSADELQAVAIWFEHNEAAPVEGAATDETKWPLKSSDLCSISELERRIGGEFTIFPEAPQSVKDGFDPSEWSKLVQ